MFRKKYFGKKIRRKNVGAKFSKSPSGTKIKN